MSVQITIQGNVIDFPTSGSSPNWAPAVTEFAQSVETALLAAVGPYDIAPQTLDIPNNQSALTDLVGISFPSTAVRSFTITYTIYRSATSPSVGLAESGTIVGVYDDLATNWILQREFVGDDAGVVFDIENALAGQLRYTSSNVSPVSGYSGKITLSAKALERGE